MSMTDPIADMLTRIRNGMAVEKRFIDIPSSNLKKRIAFVLKEEKYINDFMFVDDNVKSKIRIFLMYDHKGDAVISGIERVSRPGLRVYVGRDEIPRVLDGLGISILSTSIHNVFKLTSTNEGINPFFIIAVTVVEYVRIGVIISEPFGKFSLSIIKNIAEEPEFVITEYFFENIFDTFFSNEVTCLPS